MSRISILLITITLHLHTLPLSGMFTDNKKDSLQAADSYRAGIELGREGLNSESLDSFLVTLALRKKVFGKESNRLASTYNAIGVAYKNLGLNDLAIQNSLLAEEAYIKGYGENYKYIAGVYINLGNIYRSKLNFNEALSYYTQTARLHLNQEQVDYLDVATAYYSVAEMYFRMYNYEKAIEVIKNNINYADDYLKIYYFELLGAIYQELNDYSKASESYETAIKYSEIIFSENDIYVAIEYQNYASFLIDYKKNELAKEYLEKALNIILLTESDKGINLAEHYIILGTLKENENVESTELVAFKRQKHLNYSEAIEHYKKALYTLNFPETFSYNMDLDSMQLISKTRCFDLLKVIADIHMEVASLFEGQDRITYELAINEALEYYQITSSLIQRAKKEISDDESKILLAELEQETFIKIIQASYKAYELNPNAENLEIAFKNVEQLKSGSLFEKLSDDEAMSNSLIPDSLIQQEKKINSSITTQTENKYYETTSDNPDSLTIARIDSIIFNLQRQRTGLNDYLEENYSDYYNLKYSDNSIKISEVQTKLKNDQVLIEYTLNETDSISELYTFIISNNNIKFIKQNIDLAFINNIETMFHFMSNPRYMFTKNEDSKEFSVSSFELYKRLIEPYRNEIRDKNLVIIPDGKLSYIPFDALLQELPDTSKVISFNNLNYLIKSNRINYSYSTNLLFNFRKEKREAKNGVLAFAPEYNSDTIVIGNESFPLNPLPGTQKEINLISSEINTNTFFGQEATEINFRENSEKFDILHLAMHAFINDSLPTLSQFAFTQKIDGQIEADGLLSTADIYNLNLKARLSVLSACNTGSGKLRKGEGVISLARGFLYAGCPSIVMTLWEVEDNSGTKIMSSFYKHLKKGKTKDEALRQAKLEYLSNANSRLAHPHYWLGFVSIGDDSALYRSYDFYFFGLLFLTIIGIIGEQIIRNRKARKYTG